ncbi:hypothetical protein DB346_13795 [Verrucomicrobia bacterium LW23]|nr:hypothetical protein DB346_13795 [Verrucomicrobia bacterium LW23]
MDIEQAKLILRLHRLLPEGVVTGDARPDADAAAGLTAELGGVDLSPESVERALEMTNINPELAEWYEQELAIDDAMAEALASVEPPAGLRDRIVAAGAAATARIAAERTGVNPVKDVPAKSAEHAEDRHAGIAMASNRDGRGGRDGSRKIDLQWLVLIASVIFAAGVGYFFIVQPVVFTPGSDPLPFATITEEVPRLTESHRHALPAPAKSIAEVRAYLKSQGAPSEFDVPQGLVKFWKLNCEVALINGMPVSVLCFKLDGGRIVHLYVMDRTRLKDSPPLGVPDLKQMGRYGLASWSDKKKSYILAEPIEAVELIKFLQHEGPA